jgi:hypothetical protein
VWEVEVTDQFIEWWSTLSDAQREAVTDRVDLLAARGPDLGRPVVDRIHSSRHQPMKELRAAKGGALRVEVGDAAGTSAHEDHREPTTASPSSPMGRRR